MKLGGVDPPCYYYGGTVMITVKVLAMIFLAIYLVVVGALSLTGFVLPVLLKELFDLVPIVSGILIFISIGTCCGKGGSCEHK
jgi:hypothetical protein